MAAYGVVCGEVSRASLAQQTTRRRGGRWPQPQGGWGFGVAERGEGEGD